jgi:hypothetical protein
MAERKIALRTCRINDVYPHKKEVPAKRKKEAKKEKRVEIWKTLRVSHIPTRQTNNKVFINYLYNYDLYSSS